MSNEPNTHKEPTFPSQQHLVSASYQRLWADRDGLVAVIQKAEEVWNHGNPKKLHRRKHFITSTNPESGERSDRLESDFGQIEAKSMPHVRRLVSGERDREARLGALGMLVLHWARSVSIRHAMDRAIESALQEYEPSPEIVGAARTLFGQNQADLAERVVDDIADVIRNDVTHQAQNIFVGQVADAFNEGLRRLRHHHVQVITIDSGSVSFVAADSPVVLTDRRSPWRGSAARQIGLSEASSIWFPIGPHAGVALSRTVVDDVHIPWSGAQDLNLRTWQYAERLVLGSPDSDLNKSFGWRPHKLRFRETRRRNE